MMKYNQSVQDLLLLVVLVLLTFASFSVLWVNFNIQTLGKQNNVYLRTEACILSVPLATRTNDYITNCYLKAENTVGIQVDHFGNR